MHMINAQSVSHFRSHYREVLAKVQSDGPTLLLQNSQVVAVLVSPEQWNAQQKRIQQLELLAEAKRIDASIERGEAKTIPHDELKRLLLEKRAQGAAHVAN